MNKRKLIGNLLFLGLVFSAMVYFLFQEQDISKMIDQISNANMFYWISGMVCVIVFIGCESIIIFYLMKNIRQKVRLVHCFLYSFVGFFFSCITPSASGGQPVQVYFMRKDKIPVAISTLILMIVTVTYKMVLIALGIIILIVKPTQIMFYFNPAIGFFYLGLVLNILVVGFMIFLIFDPNLARASLINTINLLNKFHILRRPEKLINKVNSAVEKYREAASYFKTHLVVVCNVFLMSVIQRMLLFYVTYLVYRSFNLSGISWVTIILLQGMISVAVDMLPFPGGVGISEKLFLLVFLPIFGEITLPAMVISRGLSYYTELILSALLTIIAYFTIGKTRERNDIK
ncbi:MAG: lysylphosphatidylglycerol synthase transmembrane domain-containing protein [Lachnospiraceae bacterium]|nr:lysylphosphatidylglycerol synthase transmembrane domain-containing protein [Lachnospiraceae bacterium]